VSGEVEPGLIILYAFWKVKCQEHAGDSDKDGHNSYI